MTNIIVLSEDKALRLELGLQLGRRGYWTRPGASLAWALGSHRRAPADLLVVDICDAEAVGALRLQDADVPILALADPEANASTFIAALDAGADAVLGKPAPRARLTDAVDRLLEGLATPDFVPAKAA